jgi:hypothetical protein
MFDMKKEDKVLTGNAELDYTRFDFNVNLNTLNLVCGNCGQSDFSIDHGEYCDDDVVVYSKVEKSKKQVFTVFSIRCNNEHCKCSYSLNMNIGVN